MRETTAALAQVTDLMALVTAPPETVEATIHRVEVLRLQPSRVMVVAIASNGAVAKRVFDFPGAVDPGLVEWASSYLNEQLTGMGLGARMIAGRLADPELGPVEAEFIATLGAAFTELEQRGVGRHPLHRGGLAPALRSPLRRPAPRRHADDGAGGAGDACSACCARPSTSARVFLWIGGENPRPELRSVSVVGANYGLAHRNLGAVGVVGPLRMDYATAIASVRGAARELSRYCETVYDG